MEEDLGQLLGIKYSPEQQAALKELQRRANDRLRVQNLLDDDYYVEWDLYGSGGRFLVPGKIRDIGYGLGQAVHPRYIAFKFFKELSQIMLSAEMQMAIEEENEKRRATGKDAMGKTLDDGKEGELHFVMSHNLRPNNPEKLMELLPKVILGVEEEWGMDPIPYKRTPDKIRWDQVEAIINRPVQKTEGQVPVQPQQPMAPQSAPEVNPLAEVAA